LKRKHIHDECKDNGASMTGDVKDRKKLSRGQFFRFMSEQSPALVVMEACGSAKLGKCPISVTKPAGNYPFSLKLLSR
jgi:hypothetical protein